MGNNEGGAAHSRKPEICQLHEKRNEQKLTFHFPNNLSHCLGCLGDVACELGYVCLLVSDGE